MHVETDDFGILDISDDITNWELTRRSNAVSSFVFNLQNSQRKYDGKFKPSDRISVELKRITWVRVFTGTLNNAPLLSAWPRELSLSASCSLKKLQFWYWDPSVTESINMIQKYFKPDPNSVLGDGGLSGLIKESMVKVTKWDEKAIHIGAVPNAWFKWAEEVMVDVVAAASMASVLGPSATIAGVQRFSNLKLKINSRIGFIVKGQEHLDNLVQIYAVIAGQGGLTTPSEQDLAASLTIAASIAMSNGSEDANNIIGLPDKWGSVAELQNIQWSALHFLKGSKSKKLKGLLDNKNWKTADYYSVVNAIVPLSKAQAADPKVYFAACFEIAQVITKALRDQVDAQIKGTNGTAGTSALGGTPITLPSNSKYKGTGDAMAKVGYDLIESRQNDPIIYSQVRDSTSDPRNEHPIHLDCSSFISWVYYHVTGEIWEGTNTATQHPLCTEIPLAIAGDIRGALGFNGHHVGLSLGNGGWEAAAHDAYADPHQDVTVRSGGLFNDELTVGALIPGIDYTHAATSEKARAYLQSLLKTKCFLSTGKAPSEITSNNPSQTGPVSGTDGTDPFGQLVSALLALPAVGGDVFGGARALMNDQPFLPWLENLTNSSMRAFCSAPNGDFIAWFPDYFNVWKNSAIMKIRPIELINFTVDWSDQQLVTHEFVVGTIPSALDSASASIVSAGADYAGAAALLATQGIATMDFPAIFKTIYGKAMSTKFIRDYIERFGARPNVEELPNIQGNSPQEFYMALWLFMKHWSEQFNSVVQMTFMPELWPGMILQVDERNFQAYVSEVTHRGSYGDGGQFTTEATIVAPSPLDGKIKGSPFETIESI